MNSRQNIFIFSLIIILLTPSWYVFASEKSPDNLYALSAVLMDGDSGRVLYQKAGNTPRPNASTTKVMTCILALENGKGDDYVKVSANAASQPEVRLGLSVGEQYYLEDLLYSLMLQSHNDSAVAIAEYIGGSVENFSDMMNAKAKEIGCKNTHFVTPNGLDAENSGGTHHTTAEDLALIMRYAIHNDVFLKITQTEEYSFSDLSKKRHFSVHNTNALLHMTDGVLAGKTVKYTVKINEIERKQPITDDAVLAEKLHMESFDKLKEEISKSVDAKIEADRKNAAREKVLDILMANVGEIPLPKSILDGETEREFSKIANQLVRSEEDVEKFKAEKDKHLEDAKKAAEKSLKQFFVIRKIAEAEKIEVSKDEFDAQIKQMSAYFGYKEKDLLKAIRGNGAIGEIHADLLTGKVLDSIVKTAELKEV